MAVGVQQAFSVTAASNATADSNINYAEGQTPASLNNSARADMAAIKGFANQILGAKTSGGSANAQTFTSDSVAAITSYAAGRGFVFVAGYTNTGATTFNADGVGATAIRKGGAATALVANDIVAGGVYFVVYNGTYWILLNPETGQTAAGAQPLDATLTALAALAWSSGNQFPYFTAADTLSLGTATASAITALAAMTAAGAALLDDADASAQRTTLGLAIGTNVLAYDADVFYKDVGGTVSATTTFSTPATFSTGGDIVPIIHDSTGSSYIQGKTGGTSRYYTGTDATNWVVLDGVGAVKLSLNLSSAALSIGGNTVLTTASLGSNVATFLATPSSANLIAAVTDETGSGALVFGTSPTLTTPTINGGTIQSRVQVSSETGGTLTSASANKQVNAASDCTFNDGVFTAGDRGEIYAGASARSLIQDTGMTLRLDGTATTGTRTLAARGRASWYAISDSEIAISGMGVT